RGGLGRSGPYRVEQQADRWQDLPGRIGSTGEQKKLTQLLPPPPWECSTGETDDGWTGAQRRPDPMRARIADMAIVTVRYWAAAKQAAGVAEETLDGGTLADVLAAVLARHPAALALEGVLARSSFLIDGEQAGARPPENVTMHEGAVVEVLPPFA